VAGKAARAAVVIRTIAGFTIIKRQSQCGNFQPTKNAKEAEINKSFQSKVTGQKDWQILQKTFDRMK
jgi:hypothetical protein